jgi:hypothetical protein
MPCHLRHFPQFLSLCLYDSWFMVRWVTCKRLNKDATMLTYFVLLYISFVRSRVAFYISLMLAFYFSVCFKDGCICSFFLFVTTDDTTFADCMGVEGWAFLRQSKAALQGMGRLFIGYLILLHTFQDILLPKETIPLNEYCCSFHLLHLLVIS